MLSHFAPRPRSKGAIAPDIPTPAHILPTLEHLETRAASTLTAELDGTLRRILQQSDRLITRKDIKGILDLNQGLGIALQRPILNLWEQGWLSGSEHAIAEMQAAIPASAKRQAESFKLADDVARLIRELLQFTPSTFRNLPSERSIQNRALRLAGVFAKDTLDRVKADLLAAIQPQPETGEPISRDDLLKRLQGTINVSRARADNISRTESTTSYNQGRLSTYDDSALCTHLLFLGIFDLRQTDICRSRNGMWVLKSDRAAVKANTPSLHFRCRSVISPLLGAINPSHQKIIEDASRDYRRRSLVPLLKGWRPAP